MLQNVSMKALEISLYVSMQHVKRSSNLDKAA